MKIVVTVPHGTQLHGVFQEKLQHRTTQEGDSISLSYDLDITGLESFTDKIDSVSNALDDMFSTWNNVEALKKQKGKISGDLDEIKKTKEDCKKLFLSLRTLTHKLEDFLDDAEYIENTKKS